MSNAERADAPPAPTEGAAPQDDSKRPVPAARPAKWRRRLRRLAIVVVVAVLLFRLALSVLLPTVVHRTARAFGFDLSYGRLDLNLLGTQAAIWDVRLRAKDRPDNILHADYAFGNISSLALFKLKLRAYRLEVDGAEVDLTRKPDGTIPVLEQLAAALRSKQPPPAPAPLRFDAPLVVEALRVNRVTVKVRDESVSPPYEDVFTLGVRVSDVGAAGRPATLDVEVFSRSMLQTLRLQGEADLKPDTLTAKVNFSMYGLRLKDAQAYLASLGARTDDLPIALTGDAEVSLNSMPSRPGALSGTASVRDVRLSAGQEDAIRLSSGKVSIAELSPSSLHVSRVEADGGLLKLRRTPEGAVTFASLSPARRPPQPSPAASPATAAATAPTTSPAGTPFSWRLDALAATTLTGEFRDAMAAPERQFSATVQTFEVANLANTGAKDDAATLKLVLAVRDVAENVQIVGKATPFADVPAATVDFDASGVRAEVLRPYLAPLGIEPTLRAGRFRATLEASGADLAGDAPKVAVTLRDVRLDDNGAGLLNMQSVRVTGLKRDPAIGAIEVAQVAATGPSLTVRRIDADTVELPGLRYRRAKAPAAAAPTAAETPPTTATAPPAAVLPVVRVGKLTWGGANIRLEDRSVEALEPIDLSDARLDVEGFVLDLRPDAPPAPPGKLSARFSSPGVATAVQLDGTLTPRQRSLSADVAVGAAGLNLARLAPFLKPFGVEPRLTEGSFKASARATVAQLDQAVRLSGEVSGVELKDRDVRLLAMEHAGADRVDLTSKGYDVGDVTISRAYARVERDADGGIIAAGVKRLPPAPTTRPTTATTQPAPATTQPANDPFSILATLPGATLNALKVESAELDWVDRAGRKPVELKVATTASLRSFSLNQPKPRVAEYELAVSVPGMAERVSVKGTIEPQADSLGLAADVNAEGLNPAALAPYLPEGVEPTLTGGTFKASTRVTVARHPDGGVKGSVGVAGLVLRGSDAADAPLAALDSFDVDLARHDPATGDLALARVALGGFELRSTREADGALTALGLRLVPQPGKPGEQAGAPAATRPAEAPAVDVKEQVEQAKRAMPLLSLDTLDVRLKRVSFEDKLRKAAPVALADLRVWNDGPVRLLGPKPESNPPARINIAGAVEPAVNRFQIAAQAQPFAERPTAKITVDAGGIDGDGLSRIAPELAAMIDGHGLKDGRFKTTLEAEASVRRRGPTQIDLSRGLELTFALTDTALRDGESGPVLAGVGGVRGEQVKVETRTGDVTVRSLDVTNLVANAWREADGIHVLGMRLKGTEVKPDGATPSQESKATLASNPEPAAAPAAPAAAGAASSSKPEVRIDRLTVSGLDFRFEDRALDPPVLIPITSLDAEARGLSSLAMERERPVRFNVSLGAGKVSLPKKLRGGVLTGALGDLGKLAGGKRVQTAAELEDRDFFAQITAAGNIKLYPKPSGRAQASVNGVELAAIRGLASPSGINLNGGTFDARVDVKTRDDEKLDVQSRVVLTDLSVTEPPNGPIVRYLSLPAPLDVVVGAVEAPDKSITLPLHFQVDGATPKGIGPAAVGAVSQVLVTAVASAPVKTVTGVVGLFGDTAKQMEVVQEPPVRLGFVPGLTSLDADSERKLATILSRAKRDKSVRVVIEHELGQDDVDVAARRANPPGQQVAALAEGLRARRRDLLLRRDELLVRARTAAFGLPVSTGRPEASLAAYRQVNLDLAGVEDSLDRLYDLLRPGAERQADRRTRSAAVELADARLALARWSVQSICGPAASDQVRVGTARFAQAGETQSALVVSVARAIPKPRR
jgi:hypothetical protein